MFADHVANAILRQPRGDGLTIGIVGAWGSGKSGILNLIYNWLQGTRPRGERILGKDMPLVLRFNPWTVGTRAALLPELFAVITKGFESIDNPNGGPRQGRLKLVRRLRAEILKYARLLEAATAGVPLVEYALLAHGVPARGLGAAVKGGVETFFAVLKGRPSSLGAQKKRVVKLLRASPRRSSSLSMMLTDIEPAEAVEVLRLVKAVADFPNVFYLMAYDSSLLQNAVERHLLVPDGHAFLEKLVQIEFPVPLPDDFDLRGWFREEIDKIVGHALGPSIALQYEARLSAFISSQAGSLLKTPRDVIRALNSFRTGWLPIRKQVDVADYVWLTLIKLKRPQLYEWLREYTREAAHNELGASIDSELNERLLGRLEETFPNAEVRQREIDKLHEIFPAIGHKSFGQHAKLVLFNVNAGDPALARADKRISSGHYSRFYFALTPAAGSFAPEDEEKLDGILGNREALANFIVTMTARSRPQGSNMGAYTVDALLQRQNLLTADQRKAVLLSLCDTMDKVVAGQNFDQFHEWRVWDAATLILDNTLASVDDGLERDQLMQEAIGRGAALQWLVRSISRLRTGKAARGASLSTNDLSRAEDILLSRLHADDHLEALPYLLEFLWSWRRLGDEDGPRLYVERHIVSDEEFLVVMGGLRSWMFTADQAFRPINEPDTKPFIDRETARSRLQRIAGEGGSAGELANRLLEDMRMGDENYREDQETFFNEGKEQRYSPGQVRDSAPNSLGPSLEPEA